MDLSPELLAPIGPVWGTSGGVSEIAGEHLELAKVGRGSRVKGGSGMADSMNIVQVCVFECVWGGGVCPSQPGVLPLNPGT